MADGVQVKIGALMESSFGAAFNAANSAVGRLKDNLNQVNAVSARVGEMVSLKNATRDSAMAFEEARRKADAYRIQLQETGDTSKEGAAALRKLEREAAQAERTWKRNDTALSALDAELKKAGIDTNRLADEQRRLSLSAKLAEQDIGKLTRRLETMQAFKGSIGAVGSSFGNLRQSATSAFRDIGLAAGAVGGGLFAITKGAADYGDEVVETAQYLGIATGALQEFRGIAERVGVGTESMDQALAKFNVTLGKAAAGGKEAKELRRLGINLRSLSKLGPEKAMMKVADAIAKIPNPTKRAAAAQALFGRGGTKMLNVLDQGSKGLARMREEIRATGMVMGPEQLAVAGQFDDAWNGMRQTLLGLRNTIGVALIPVFNDLFNRLSTWVRGNRGQVQAFANKLADAVGKIAKELPDLVSGIGKVGAMLWGAADATQQFLGGWDNLAIALIGARLLPVAMSVGQLGVNLWNALGAAKAMFAAGGVFAEGGVLAWVGNTLTGIGAAFGALSWPILAAGAAILLVGALVYKYWEPIKAFFGGFWKGFMDGLQPVLTSMEPLISGFSELWNIIKEMLEPVQLTSDGFEKATSAGVKFGEYVGTAINNLLLPIRLVLDGLNAIGNMAGWVGQKLGLNDGQTAVATAGMTPEAAARLARQSAPTGASLAGSSISNTNNITIQGGDPQATAKAVSAELDRRARESSAAKRQSTHGASGGW